MEALTAKASDTIFCGIFNDLENLLISKLEKKRRIQFAIYVGLTKYKDYYGGCFNIRVVYITLSKFDWILQQAFGLAERGT